MNNYFLMSYFYIDSLSIIMLALVSLIGVCVASFSIRYLKGDIYYRHFFLRLLLIVISIDCMVIANNLILLFIFWCINNFILVHLMIHKATWKAAKAAGKIAAKYYIFGCISIFLSFLIFYVNTGSLDIQSLVFSHAKASRIIFPLLLLLIGAMVQSAIWPFHRWLLSSLNSPTPVSAIMHAGLVNGGGFLLVRFSPLYLSQPHFLELIFVFGVITAVIGIFWKLIQTDVKRMLACSTMAQMGFMFAQCGMGFFASAVSHLTLHGMFKAYLFLSSGSAAQDKFLDKPTSSSYTHLTSSAVCGLIGTYIFSLFCGETCKFANTTTILLLVIFMSSSQFAFAMLRPYPVKKLPIAILLTSVIGFIYGSILHFINFSMLKTIYMQPQPLNVIHLLAILAFALPWLYLLINAYQRDKNNKTWMLKAYVHALNQSQPHPTTITSYRNQYNYL